MAQFEIAFSGQLAAGADPEQVKPAIQRLFNASEQLMAQLFSGRRVVIKQAVDQATALKYQKAFTAAGAMLEVKPLSSEPVSPEPPASSATAPTTASQPAPATPVAKPVAASQPSAAVSAPAAAHGAQIQAPDFGLAPAGADLLLDKPQVQVLDIDISAIKLAPEGSDAGYSKPAEEPVKVQIEHLHLVD